MSENSSCDAATRTMLVKTLTTIEHLVGTLDGFLAEEKVTIARIERVKEQLKELEGNYVTLRCAIEATGLSKATMDTVAHDLRCILSPIKILPTEILIHIFSITIEDVDNARRIRASTWHRTETNLTSLYLAQVCGRWRQIFSLHPSLWSQNELHPPWGDNGTFSHFSYYAERGSRGQQSLFIPNWNLETQRIFLETLVSPSTSFKCLEVDISDDQDGSWDVKSLHAHEVILYRDFSTPTIRYFTPLLQSASKVTIYGNPPDWGTLPWPTLQTLALKQFCYVEEEESNGIAFSGEDFVQLLNATPSLTRLELDFDVNESLPVVNKRIVMVHNHMQYLSLHLDHFSGGKGVFGIYLDLPALHTLELLSIHYENDPGDEEEPIINGLTPKVLILPALELYEVALAARVPHCLPRVERLDLTGIHSRSLLRALHPRNGQHHSEIKSVPIPNLRTLHIDDSDVDGETLLAFISARLELHGRLPAQVCALESIYMYDTPGVTVPHWNKIQAMLEEERVANGAVLA